MHLQCRRPGFNPGLGRSPGEGKDYPFQYSGLENSMDCMPETYLLLFYWLSQKSLWLCGSQQTGKFLNRWEYHTNLPASWEICMQLKKQQLELDMEQWAGFQIGKGVRQGYIFSPCSFNLYAEFIMQNAGLDEAQAWVKIAGRNINNLRYADDTTRMAESELKSLLMKMKEESEKVGLNHNIQKTKIIASSSITSWQIDGETIKTVTRVYFLGL